MAAAIDARSFGKQMLQDPGVTALFTNLRPLDEAKVVEYMSTVALETRKTYREPLASEIMWAHSEAIFVAYPLAFKMWKNFATKNGLMGAKKMCDEFEKQLISAAPKGPCGNKANCGNQEPVTTMCGRCKLVFYCNVDCQRRDWSAHKLVCKKN